MKESHPFSDHGLQMDGVSRIQLSKSWYNFTDTQDIRAVVGCKAHVNHKGQVKLVRFQMPDCNHNQTGRHLLCYDGCRLVVCCNLYVPASIGPAQHSVSYLSIYLCALLQMHVTVGLGIMAPNPDACLVFSNLAI